MKMIPWILLGVSVILFLLGGYSLLASRGSFAFGINPEAWWRAAMAAAVYCIAFKLLHQDRRSTT